ncbi:hypothetical protein BGW39_011029, partial [Mortierella sp. 14UC]
LRRRIPARGSQLIQKLTSNYVQQQLHQETGPKVFGVPPSDPVCRTPTPQDIQGSLVVSNPSFPFKTLSLPELE